MFILIIYKLLTGYMNCIVYILVQPNCIYRNLFRGIPCGKILATPLATRTVFLFFTDKKDAYRRSLPKKGRPCVYHLSLQLGISPEMGWQWLLKEAASTELAFDIKT